MTWWHSCRVLALQSMVAGSISSCGDHSMHCWWALIRSKQLSSVSVWRTYVFAVFSGHGNSVHNILISFYTAQFSLRACKQNFCLSEWNWKHWHLKIIFLYCMTLIVTKNLNQTQYSWFVAKWPWGKVCKHFSDIKYFLSNTNDLHTATWFLVFLSNRDNFKHICLIHSWDPAVSSASSQIEHERNDKRYSHSTDLRSKKLHHCVLYCVIPGSTIFWGFDFVVDTLNVL